MRGTVAHLAAQEHVNDLVREAERQRQQAQVRPRSSIALALPRFAAARLRRSYRVDAGNPSRARA
jgi:hypothetical protein